MSWSLVVVVVGLVACGAQPAPQPAPVRPEPMPQTKRPAQPITCADVAVILRGKVEDEKAAGPMKEEAIAKSCLHDKWSSAIVACVGEKPKPKTCLDSLTKEQRTAHTDRLAGWHDEFPDEEFEEEVADDDHLDYIDCADGIGDVSLYAPVLAQGKDRELAVALRRTHVLALCEDWSIEVRRCFESKLGSAQCRQLLEVDQKQELVDRLTDVDTLIAKVAVLKPAATECKAVVAFHYGDAHWKGKLAHLNPKERKKLVGESRARMQKACADEKWSASLRGCIVVSGGDTCFTASGLATWSYPASGIPFKTGIAECDAYGDALRALAGCAQIPKQAGQAMLDQYQRQAPSFANLTAAQRVAAANSCKQSDAAIRQSAKTLGCAI